MLIDLKAVMIIRINNPNTHDTCSNPRVSWRRFGVGVGQEWVTPPPPPPKKSARISLSSIVFPPPPRLQGIFLKPIEPVVNLDTAPKIEQFH